MRIKVYDNAEKLFGAAAETAASLMRKESEFLCDDNGNFRRPLSVCLSADTANIGMMKELVSEDISWKNTKVYSSWEFVNENSVSEISRRKKIDDTLLSKLTTFNPDFGGDFFKDAITPESATRFSADAADGFDVLFTEVMPYGALAINLPLTDCYDCRTVFRESEDLLGSAVVTVSPYGVMKSRHVVAVASGYSMAQWVAYMLSAEFSRKCPAAILKEHRDFILLLDKEAASVVPSCYL